MKFFHVYNEDCFRGLEKNGLINEDTGFKIQHIFSMPDEKKFNRYAAKGTKLHSLIRNERYPFYIDRLAGGCVWHDYTFDKALIREYADLLGDWFLGFQLHEAPSGRRDGDWQTILKAMNGHKGPYDPKELWKRLPSPYATLPDGTILRQLGLGTVDEYAKLQYAETVEEYLEEVRQMFRWRMDEVDGHILPCDSFYLLTKMEDELGMKSFMPEVGWQIPMMRMEVALARGIAKAAGKTWGTYYECWLDTVGVMCTLPCYNTEELNEWYLLQEKHPDNFSDYGPNGGSSRLLQNRIYYYSLMAGADYLSEEWGLNCSYTDMQEFTLSPYGQVKKDFIQTARTMRGMQALTPFAIVLPKKYSCVQIRERIYNYQPETYMRVALPEEELRYKQHVEAVLDLIFEQNEERTENESRVITNSRFGDVFDIIYEDTDAEAMKRYAYLIDATPDGDFARNNGNIGLKILKSGDLDQLTATLDKLIPMEMPCYVDGLCWLVSYDEQGRRFLSVFNNAGNTRTITDGDTIDHTKDRCVTIICKTPANLRIVKEGSEKIILQKKDPVTYTAMIPAAGFGIFEF